ncbi:MAG: mechanosensitive ion channel family protein [Gemmatimonadota bacterium]|nr:mechanosensitive ion channel family protein [Gemmatimonadota bacterium]MDH3476874.1 mechanosensitive ion channel family protein [Gemmatimonadota bacterium]MDH3571062.1 mechanosensitive ion channel family protein [Gemmatimonadota bacterium]MDH5548498.1 mechanosensitive ion channel family protein [Gemmatimonadota bacterium]
MEDFARTFLLDPTVGKIVAILVGLLLITLVVRAVHRTLPRYVRENDTRYRVRKIITFLGYLAGFLYLTVVFRNQLGGLTVAFGVAGAGIAFALQEVIASVAGWVAVALGNFYRVGDRVQLGGIRGDVIDVGVLRTTLMECGNWVNGDLYNGRIVRVANSFVFKEPVFNYSGDFPFLWEEITVPVKYGCDHRLAREIIHRTVTDVVGAYAGVAKESWKDMVAKYRIEDASVEPMVTLVANDNWMEFTARFVVDYKRRRTTKDEIFSRLLDAIDATGGRVALASATFELVGAPPVDVHLLGGGKQAGS